MLTTIPTHRLHSMLVQRAGLVALGLIAAGESRAYSCRNIAVCVGEEAARRLTALSAPEDAAARSESDELATVIQLAARVGEMYAPLCPPV